MISFATLMFTLSQFYLLLAIFCFHLKTSGFKKETPDGVEHLLTDSCFKETQFRLYSQVAQPMYCAIRNVREEINTAVDNSIEDNNNFAG